MRKTATLFVTAVAVVVAAVATAVWAVLMAVNVPTVNVEESADDSVEYTVALTDSTFVGSYKGKHAVFAHSITAGSSIDTLTHEERVKVLDNLWDTTIEETTGYKKFSDMPENFTITIKLLSKNNHLWAYAMTRVADHKMMWATLGTHVPQSRSWKIRIVDEHGVQKFPMIEE